MPLFMNSYIDKNVDVASDGNCGIWIVTSHLGKGKENHAIFQYDLIRLTNNHVILYQIVFVREIIKCYQIRCVSLKVL